MGEYTDDGTATGRDGTVSSGDEPIERRGQSLYDRWSDHDGLYARVMSMATPLREDAFETLDPAAGERILDLGSGTGLNFERLRAGVGPDGEVVGLDYSPGMLETATDRIERQGWENVRVVRDDATRMDAVDGPFDVAVTTFALHTMEDVDAVVENVYDVLAPGGRFVALDGRGLQSWPARALNPVFERTLSALVNHQRDQDPLGAIRATFDAVEVVETYDAGSGYLAVAEKAPDADV